MNSRSYRTLVVDDDAGVRHLTVRALTNEGFVCDVASDGNEAAEKTRSNSYDIVITDLRMPHRHGHSLAVELLQMENRPLIIVLTGVCEPRLSKDLLARGVDDIVWKPVAYENLAAKIKMLIQRRQDHQAARATLSAATNSNHGQLSQGFMVSRADIGSKLAMVNSVLPVSQAAQDVYHLAASNECSAQQLAVAAARDPALVAELLRLANSSYYNPNTERVLELESAVARIGQNRVGELALATSLSAVLTRKLIPWMDANLVWRRSLAAGAAMELLVAEGRYEKIAEGLRLCAILNSMGRVVLAGLYQQHYQQMVEQCKHTGECLFDQEQLVFAENHTQVMARLLDNWKTPPEISRPLTYLLDDYAVVARLAEPTRTKVELVKLAVLIGTLSVGHLEAWDRVELPPTTLLERLRISRLPNIVEQTRADAQRIIHSSLATSEPAHASGAAATAGAPAFQLAYDDVARQPYDSLSHLIGGMGIQLSGLPEDLDAFREHVLLNCLGLPVRRLAGHVAPQLCGRVTFVVDADKADEYRECGAVIPIPNSYGVLRDAFLKIAHKQTAAFSGV